MAKPITLSPQTTALDITIMSQQRWVYHHQIWTNSTVSSAFLEWVRIQLRPRAHKLTAFQVIAGQE